MANKLYEETHIQNIANAIREKTGKEDLLTVGDMATEIESIEVATITQEDMNEIATLIGGDA